MPLIRNKKKEKQKKRVKIILKIMLIIFIFIFLLCLYVTKIGTTSLLVNETMISASNLPSSFHGLKVIQFSDVHYENKVLLEQTVAAINKRKPDLVFFTGDLLKDDNLSSSDRQDLTEQLKKITTTIGKYAVLGETDNEEAISILIDCGFTILNNNYEKEEVYYLDLAEKYATIMNLSQVGEENLECVRDFVSLMGKEFLATFDSLWIHGDNERLEVIADLKSGNRLVRRKNE